MRSLELLNLANGKEGKTRKILIVKKNWWKKFLAALDKRTSGAAQGTTKLARNYVAVAGDERPDARTARKLPRTGL